jgi:RNA polymerase sigma factor (sigma-70 family)
MIDLTNEQIAAAKANDTDAVTAVIRATDERVVQLARKYATTGGYTNADLAEELAQIGRVAVWECISRFAGEDVAQFFTYMDSTVSGTLSDARRADQRHGVSSQAAKDFEAALRMAGGDPYEAQHLAASAAMGKRRMSPDMAHAARLSWQGEECLDAPARDAEGTTLSALIDERYGVPADLVEPSDLERERRAATRDRVHDTLGRMGAGQRDILKGTFGISPAPYFGTDNEDDLADYAGCARSQVRANRVKAKARFEALYGPVDAPMPLTH